MPSRDCCSIGNGVVIGHGAIIHAKLIGDFVGIGKGSILSVWSEVVRGSVVAEEAIVKRGQKISESVIVAGNPAKKLRDLSQKERDCWDYGRKLYVDLLYCVLGMEKIAIP